MQSVLTIIKAGVEFTKKNWRNIAAAIGFVGVVASIVGLSFQLRDLELTTKELEVAREEFEVAKEQFEVAKEQLEYERSLQPKLEYEVNP